MAKTADEIVELFEELSPNEAMRRIAAQRGEWAGIPMPHEDYRLIVEERYPYQGIANLYEPEETPEGPAEEPLVIRNSWWSRRRSERVWILEDTQGRITHDTEPRRGHADRLTFWLSTMNAARVWDPKAELEAMSKLAELISGHAMGLYTTTGSFLETSPRSHVTYLFRRGRPTVALAPIVRGNEDMPMKVLAVLCMHPIAFYEGTWAGAMVPTDDVIAHLLMMRGDEHLFWRRANQHHPDSPEAGI